MLFDIDGTLLLRASREHADAVRAAVLEVFEVSVADVHVETAGRTDAAIARDLALAAGVPGAVVDEGSSALIEAACRHYDRLCPDDLTSFVAPGVPEMLAALSAEVDVMTTLTGNFAPIARRKLAAAGIGHHFHDGQGAYGSDHADRNALPAIARARAGRRACGRAYPRDRTVVIGDTPLDIACARADGVAVIAIATGPFEAPSLAGADVVVHAADELPAAIRSLRAAAPPQPT